MRYIRVAEISLRRVPISMGRDFRGISVSGVSGRTIAAGVCQSLIGSKDREHVCVLYLDGRCTIQEAEIVGVGTFSSALIDPKAVFRGAILHGASGIIVAHNHPSGNVSPSVEDIAAMDRLAKVGQIVGVQLLDAMVVSEVDFAPVLIPHYAVMGDS